MENSVTEWIYTNPERGYFIVKRDEQGNYWKTEFTWEKGPADQLQVNEFSPTTLREIIEIINEPKTKIFSRTNKRGRR